MDQDQCIHFISQCVPVACMLLSVSLALYVIIFLQSLCMNFVQRAMRVEVGDSLRAKRKNKWGFLMHKKKEVFSRTLLTYQ